MLRLTKEREARGWSKLELARQARLAPGFISQIEQGRYKPYPVQLQRLSAALDWRRDPERLLEEDAS